MYKFKKLAITEKLEKSLCNIHDPIGGNLSLRLRPQFTNLKEHQFRQGFYETVIPMCPFGSNVETILNIFSCVVIMSLIRGLNPLIIFTDLTHHLEN